MSELTFLPAVSMAQQVREKKVSPVDLVEAHLARIEKLNPKLNAFVQVDAVGAREQARQAEDAVVRNENLGPLHGVPLSIKSSIQVKGLRCEAGTKLRAGLVAEKDAPLVSRLRDAGAIILGTTNTPELLMAWETDNLLYGRSNNPWDLSRTPGGSSGGEAAAIASGCSAGGVGSDGGGSIRVPAHFSGICGLKPTPGRIPATGHFPTPRPPRTVPAAGPETRTTASPARPGALARAKIVSSAGKLSPCPFCRRPLRALSQRNFWNCSKALAPPKRHPGLHHGLGVAGVEGRLHARLHLFHHFLLQRRDIGQAHEGAGLFRGHVHLDIHFHGTFTLSRA